MKNLVIGLGEVGYAVREILECDGHDPFKKVEAIGEYNTLHITIPYSNDFVKIVRQYEKKFKSSLTIIHSSVPVGTCNKLKAVHSPIRGVHPHMVKGIKTFVKFFGGKRAKEASKIFKEKGIITYCTTNSKNTEAGKLWDTTQYGVFILLNKEIYSYCKKNKLDPDIVYKMFNITYNAGYTELKRKEVVRPYLNNMEGKIGGHCVINNCNLLDSPIAKEILEKNSKL